MVRVPPSATRTDTRFPTRRSSDLSFGRMAGLFTEFETAVILWRGSLLPLGCEADAFAAAAQPSGTVRRFAKSPRHNFTNLQIRAPFPARRSEDHTSELQSLMRISYALFCSKTNNTPPHTHP